MRRTCSRHTEYMALCAVFCYNFPHLFVPDENNSEAVVSAAAAPLPSTATKQPATATTTITMTWDFDKKFEKKRKLTELNK